ncbi:glycerate kinase [Schumannella luteola]|uniref:Glycerate kinase n=1 Tax=Schumannella luteola TaxID=472059 RepID=A0A852YIT9_9MICO|nr:glycerate kinase [Schumannella luteola]NYG97699.1 glycerate kinase [Schumannella luteola]TPX01432.1 glycerate kinase [Schumannella luteola]
MRVLIAMDKFKGTATAAEAGESVARGLITAVPSLKVEVMALADGGDGTLAALLGAGYERVDIDVPDARGVVESAPVAHRKTEWIIEVAAICGLGAARPTPRMAETADSSGIGAAIEASLDRGATEIRVGLGGTATSDGGAGMLRRLGVRFRDAQGGDIPPGAAALRQLASIDWSGLDPRLATARIIGLCDVTSPLLGPTGAAAVFGPQKGADATTVDRIEKGLTRLAAVSAENRPPAGPLDAATAGAGAAGGLGWALLAIGGALVSGGELIAQTLQLDRSVEVADLVVTGEGRLDPQSLSGKAPAIVAASARRARVPVVAVVGQDQLGDDALALGLTHVIALADLAAGTDRDPALTLRTLELAGTQLATRLRLAGAASAANR